MLRHSPSTEAPLFTLGPDGCLCGAEPAFADLLGLTPAQLDGRPLLEVVHPDDATEVVAGLTALAAGQPEVLVDNRFVPRDGGSVHLQWVARTGSGGPDARACVRDVTQLDRRVAERADLRVRLALALGPPPVATWDLDLRSGRLHLEPAAAALLGTGVRPLPCSAAELAGALLPEDGPAFASAVAELTRTGRAEVTVRAPHSAGPRQLRLRGRVVDSDRRGRPRRAAGLLLDITAERAVEQQMVRMSTSGTLDGIPSRRAFDQALRGEWRRCTRSFEPLSVIVVDLDDFASLNERYGHRVGDDALAAVARALARSLHRAGDVLARFGGQEFAVVLPGIDGAGALAVGQRLVEAVRAVTVEEAPGRRLSISVGTSTWVLGCPTASAEQLLDQASRALYGAKGAGKDQVVLTLPEVTGPAADE